MEVSEQNAIQDVADKQVVPTWDHNHESPYCKFSSRSLKQSNVDLESSFTQHIEEVHVEAIWDSSIKFLQQCLLQPFDKSFGINNSQFFSELDFDGSHKYQEQDLCIPKILEGAKNLKLEERMQMSIDMKNQRDLSNMILGVYEKYQTQIFNEIFLVIKHGWEEYIEYKKKSELPKEWQKLCVPRFFDLSPENIQNYKQDPQYIPLSFENLIQSANLVAESAAHKFYIATELSYINLKQLEAKKREDREVAGHFLQFIKSIIRSVFLCAQGYFLTPHEKQDKNINSIMGASSRNILEEDYVPSFGEIKKSQSLQ